MLLTIFVIYTLLGFIGKMLGIALLQNLYFNIFAASFIVSGVKTYSDTERSINSLIRNLNARELSEKALQQITAIGENVRHNFKTKLNITLPDKINYYLINDPALNASAVGRNNIIFTSGLLKKINISELHAILAHEYAHLAYLDSVHLQMYCSVANVTVHLTNFFRKIFAFVMTIISGFGVIGIILFILILPVALTIIALMATGLIGCKIIKFFRMIFERKEEFRADMAACKVGYAEEFCRGMEKIEEYKTSSESMFVTMFSTHPPTYERLKRADIYIGGERIKNNMLGRYAHTG